VGHRLLLSGWLRPFTAGDGWLCPIRAQVSRSRRRRCHQRPLGRWPGRRRVPAARCRIEPFLDQGGACGAAGPASAPRSALGGPRGARRAAAHKTTRSAHLTRRTDPMHAPGPLVTRCSVRPYLRHPGSAG
jgi:hypothetical protein